MCIEYTLGTNGRSQSRCGQTINWIGNRSATSAPGDGFCQPLREFAQLVHLHNSFECLYSSADEPWARQGRGLTRLLQFPSVTAPVQAPESPLCIRSCKRRFFSRDPSASSSLYACTRSSSAGSPAA